MFCRKQEEIQIPAEAETSMDFKMQLGKVVDNYLLLKDTLVASNEGDAEESAKKTLKAAS